jgi:hypothetical protein
MPDYTYLSLTPSTLDSGRPLAFGDDVTLSSDEVKANSRLIDSGSLVEKPAPKPEASAKANSSKTEESN